MPSMLTVLSLLATTAHAVPGQFTHQGRLLDADGVPLEGEATIIFRVANDEMGGDELWEETITVSLTNGFYSAILGADEDANPLDTDVFSQAPAWLELQLEGEPAMFPRSPIHAVPFATMATVAEEVSGGPVDASQIAIDGTPVVNESGEWVGPTPAVNWSDIEGIPDDFADGIDDDTDTDTDSLAALGTSCLDGDIPVWDGVLMAWSCGIDAVLTADEVDAIVADNGYAMESELFSSSFLDLTDVPDGLSDGDDNTQLTEADVDAMVSDNGYAMAVDAFSRAFSDLTGIPDGVLDGDDNTQLTEADVDAMVSDNGYALASETATFDDALAALTAQVASLQTAVEAIEGEADVLNSVVISEDTTLTAAQSGSRILHTAPATISLPSVESGLHYRITIQGGIESETAVKIDAGSEVIIGSLSSNANGTDPTVNGTNTAVQTVTVDSSSGTLNSGGHIDLFSDGTNWFISGHLSASTVLTIDFGGDGFAPSSMGCADGSVEVEWSDDVVGCGGPGMSWLNYRNFASEYCAAGWAMAGASIVNEHLTSPGYDEDIYYAFNGQGCNGHDNFSTTYNGYAQTRSECGWSYSHHLSISESYGVHGIVCEKI